MKDQRNANIYEIVCFMLEVLFPFNPGVKFELAIAVNVAPEFVFSPGTGIAGGLRRLVGAGGADRRWVVPDFEVGMLLRDAGCPFGEVGCECGKLLMPASKESARTGGGWELSSWRVWCRSVC